MAKSGARKEAAPVRSSATSPPQQHIPGAPASSCANRWPQQLFYPGAPTSSSASPSTPPYMRPMYTPAPEDLLSFGQFLPMHNYNFQPPQVQHPVQGHQNMDTNQPADGSDDEAEASIIDPSSLYTLDHYLVQMDMLDSFAKEIALEVKESLDA
ncbi:uncharacterized protein [Triticum aestivum]|uniref:uncharacterized protein isoform X2 n=1 Tax=Triticum aestivum TaxID=4565 RepID=UPI001D02292A|nr:uncharacterized protein LOC123062753 isoform X2 [Triticum aestivum]